MGAAQSAKVLVFIPTYNDFDLLPSLVTQILGLSPAYTVLVIDDGSSTDFDTALLPERCLYLRLPDNLGLGVCTHIAFDHALRHGYAWLARIDADGQHPVARLPEFVAALTDQQADLAIGVRDNHREQRATALAATVIKGYYSLVGRLVSGGKTPEDMNTGFFVLSQKAVSLLNRMPLDRYPEPLLFIRACRCGLRLVEIRILQHQRQYGQSSLNLVQALRMFYRFNITIIAELSQKRQGR